MLVLPQPRRLLFPPSVSLLATVSISYYLHYLHLLFTLSLVNLSELFLFRSGISAIKGSCFLTTTVQPADIKDWLQIWTCVFLQGQEINWKCRGSHIPPTRAFYCRSLSFFSVTSVWFVCYLFSVHRRSYVWRGESHVHSLPEFKKTEDRHLSQGQCRRVSCQPTSSLGTGHWYPESLAAGLHTFTETH